VLFLLLYLIGVGKIRKEIILIFVILCLISSSLTVSGLKINLKQNSNKNLFSSEEDIIPDILQQITEEMILDYIQDLVAIAEKYEVSRLTGTEGCEEAADYIINEFLGLGLKTKLHDWAEIGLIIPYKHLLFVSENIEGTLSGKQDSNQIIVIMAHYDTTAITPSADDNSAGVAAVLSAAKILSQYEFNHEIRFLLVSGEEEGLLGSTAYAKNSYQTCESIVNVINLDMIGYSSPEIEDDEYKVRIYETCSDKITNTIINICSNPDYSPFINFEVTASDDDTGHVSDQRSFCNYGFDTAFIHEYTWNDNKDTGTDTIENMDVNYATRVARLAAAVIAKYALDPILDNNAPTPPKYVQGPEIFKINEEQTFTTTTIDPDGDEIFYMFDWGDDTHSNWLGPYNSNEICQATHIWQESGEYIVKAKAKDSNGIQSSWVNSPKNKNFERIIFQKIIAKYPFFNYLLKNWLKILPCFYT